MSASIAVSVAIFLVTYFGLINKRIDRTIAVLAGSVAMVIVGTYMNFYSQDLAIGSIDFNTIGLLLGMMMIVGILGETGFFRYVAIKTAKLSNGSYYRLLALFILVTALTSAFLDNVTTILLMAPVTINIAKDLNINPTPFLFSEIISSNIGGTATLIGDPPNIMVASAAGLYFTQFIIYIAPIVLIILFIVLLIFELLFKDILEKDMGNFKKVTELDENKSIVDWILLKKTMLVLVFTLILFSIHHILNLELWVVAMTGASLLLLITLTDPEDALKHVHWSTLIFFMGLFVLIGGLVHAGVMDIIAYHIGLASGNSLFIGIFIVIMLSGTFAIVIGNIPAAIMLIPVVGNLIEITELGMGYPVNPLWWALALGACLGGNGALTSSPANLIASNISERMGYPFSFREYTRLALPITIFTLLLAFGLLYGFYVVLLGP